MPIWACDERWNACRQITPFLSSLQIYCQPLDKLKKQFDRVAVIVDNAAYHDSRRVRRYLKKNDGYVKLIFLPAYSPFLNPAEWLWRNDKAKIRRTFRRPAKSYFRRKVMSVYESHEIKFNPRNILFKNLDKILPA